MERIEANNCMTSVKQEEGHSCSFYLAIVLIVCMLLQYYLPVFVDIEETFFGGYIFPLIPGFIFIFEIIFLFLRNTRISYRVLGMLLAVMCALALSLLNTRSGIEKTFGLLSILVGMFVLYKEPLCGKERGTIFWIFVIAVALILVNGVRGDANLELEKGKFNPNGCAFLLTMLFCMCFTGYCATRFKRYILVAVLCFALQFVYISRTALLGELIFVFSSVAFRAWKKNSFSPAGVFWAILLFSVLGVVLAWFYSEILFPAVGYGKIVIFGKDIFTGRQTIWGFAFESINEHFLFGVGSHLNEAQFEAGYYELIMNAHNQAVGMLGAFGIFAFILFYIAFSFFAAQPYRRKEGRPNRFPVIFLLTVTIMSYFDLYFFSEYNWIPILIAYGPIYSLSIKEKA